MRHRKTVLKLGRTAAHRKAMLANLSGALFKQKHVKTTEAKAKAARRFSEKLITLAKKESVHARRTALRRLRDRKVVNILFDEIAPQYSDRNGGYTRVVKLGQRHGDGADMAILELVGFDTAKKKKKAREAKAEAEDTKKTKSKDKEKPAEDAAAAEEKENKEAKDEKGAKAKSGKAKTGKTKKDTDKE